VYGSIKTYFIPIFPDSDTFWGTNFQAHLFDSSSIHKEKVHMYRRVKKPKQRVKRRASSTRIALTIFAIFLAVTGAFFAIGYYYYTKFSHPLASFIQPVSKGPGETGLNAASIDAIDGRSWNILLMGSDNDNKYIFPALLTQVMMVVHVDTSNNSMQMVSIPRDSWVMIPSMNQMHKIDQAFFFGATQQNDTPMNEFANGVRLARETVEMDYGITIDRYAWVGLSGFAKVIDTLGGVEVNVAHPIVDDTYPKDTGKQSDASDPNAYQRLYLAPGPQHLNGEQTLQYVRSRHADLIGDVGRTQRQQQVLQALKQKLTVPTIADHFQDLLKDLTGQVYTDLSETEILAFANFARTVNTNDIQRVTLGPGTGTQNYGHDATVYDPTSKSRQDVIIPQCENIEPLILNIFGPGNLLRICFQSS
jgi:polyisoprenyl-teichoic acid--peptidoglycan teichoic acid transferase